MEKKPQSIQKVLNYLSEFVASDYFQKEIETIRKTVGIPEEGYAIKPDDEKAIKTLDIFYLPSELTKKQTKECRILLREVIDKFPISNINISYGFFVYLVHNTFREIVFEQGLSLDNLCKLVDMRMEFEEKEGVPEVLEDSIDEMTKRHPIALYIHPEASQRDIVEYVKKMWDYIEIYKNKYKDTDSKVGKVRTKNKKIKERNLFIYKHKNLPRRKIASLVAEQFNDYLDYGHIGKIISIEDKRRKEV